MSVPELHWHDTRDGGRALYAGDQTEPVALGTPSDTGWRFRIDLPGEPLKQRRIGNRTVGENIVLSIVSAWFKLAERPAASSEVSAA